MLLSRLGFLFTCYSTVSLLLDTALQLHFGILSLTAWRFALHFVTYSWEIFIFHSGVSWSCSQHHCPRGHANKEIQQQTKPDTAVTDTMHIRFGRDPCNAKSIFQHALPGSGCIGSGLILLRSTGITTWSWDTCYRSRWDLLLCEGKEQSWRCRKLGWNNGKIHEASVFGPWDWEHTKTYLRCQGFSSLSVVFYHGLYFDEASNISTHS